MLENAALAVACLFLLAACARNERPAAAEADGREAERLAMVAQQIEARGIGDPQVLEAMRTVPRHWFVPESQAALAYADGPLPIPAGQTISQPYIVALMTEALRLRPDSKVLEIGTGSGYQAAVLAAITPQVYTIEIVPELADWARAVFDAHGYTTITAREGDGYQGWPEHAPFDAIIVTAAPDHVPPALIEQLAPGGRLCLPVGGEHAEQELLVLTRQADGSTTQQTLAPVRFVPMTGAARDGEDR
ncbi:MAG TPA: protein-L-isoaspartate(D-aspartate) O-methyltransferase [Planctomycetota bacterium]|nr:protein-L-isoaspartate(D-aspartate) O-methyltransferase [Planctomycetota bacterium]